MSARHALSVEAADLVEVFALHAAGRTRVIAETRDLVDVNEAMAEVLSGQVPARLVFEFTPVPAVPLPATLR